MLPARRASLPGEQPPGSTRGGQYPRVLTHESDISKMDKACIEGDVDHDLKIGLASHFRIQTGVVVPHEPCGLEIVADEPMTSAVALRRGIHEEVDFVQRNDAKKVAGRRKVLPQAGPVPADYAELGEFPSTSSKSSWISCSPYLSWSMANLFNTLE